MNKTIYIYYSFFKGDESTLWNLKEMFFTKSMFSTKNEINLVYFVKY